MSSLPRFMLLKSNANGKFLCCEKDKLKTTNLTFSYEINSPEGATTVAADQLVVESKRAGAGTESSSGPIDFHMIKFEVEEAKTAPGFVHIRTCYNNKFLIRKCLESSSSCTITAEAHEAEEDQSKPTCTLFKPVFVEDEDDDEDEYVFGNKHGIGKPPQKKIQLIHVSQFGQHYLGVGNDNGSIRTGGLQHLIAASSDNSLNPTYFMAYNVSANIILPEHFTLMGQDDKYISGYSGNNLGFATTDVGGTNVALWTSPQSHPTSKIIYINSSPRLAWTLNNNNGVHLVNPLNNTLYTFSPVNAGNNRMALYNLSTRNYVQRVKAGTYDGLSAATTLTSITDPCKLRIGEPVRERTVSEPYYDLANARIYGTGNFQMYNDSRSNYTTIDQSGTFEVEYVKSHTSTFNQSLTVNIGVKFTKDFNIPWVGSTGVELSTTTESTTEWGSSTTEEETIRYTQHVTIPSRKRVILRVLSTRSSCDVPLTCKVRDVMTSGIVREYTKTDIVFTGINSYNFDTVLIEEDVP